LLDVQVQSLMILQWLQYLHTVSRWLTENNSIPPVDKAGRNKGVYKTTSVEELY